MAANMIMFRPSWRGSFDHSSFNPEDIEIYAKAIALPGRTRGGLEWYRTLTADHAAALEYKKRPLRIRF